MAWEEETSDDDDDDDAEEEEEDGDDDAGDADTKRQDGVTFERMKIRRPGGNGTGAQRGQQACSLVSFPCLLCMKLW